MQLRMIQGVCHKGRDLPFRANIKTKKQTPQAQWKEKSSEMQRRLRAEPIASRLCICQKYIRVREQVRAVQQKAK